MTTKTRQKTVSSTSNGAITNDPTLAARLKQEWQELQQQIEAGSLDADTSRAEKLADYKEKGLTQREIAAAIDLTLSHVNHLLRYHRFCLFSAENKIPERQFRAYWNQVRDPQVTRGENAKREIDAGYEQKVFKAIAEMIAAGKKPLHEKRKVKPSDLKKLRPITKARKAVREVYDRLQPTIVQLKALLGCDRSTFAPSIIAGYAQTLDRDIKELFRVLADVSEGK